MPRSGLLTEPALMVSAHGAMKFDHAGYRKMAEEGPMVVTSYDFRDLQVLFPNPSTAVMTYRVTQGITPRGTGKATIQEMNDTSTWIQRDAGWQCVMHTETPVAGH